MNRDGKAARTLSGVSIAHWVRESGLPDARVVLVTDGSGGDGGAGGGAIPGKRKGGAPPGMAPLWGAGNWRVGVACAVAIARSVVMIPARLGRPLPPYTIVAPWGRSCDPNAVMSGAVPMRRGVVFPVGAVPRGVGLVCPVGVGTGTCTVGADTCNTNCVAVWDGKWRGLSLCGI